MPTTLYQFPLSHYCEKARWALDHKNIAYQVRNLLPGLHVKTIKKIAPRSQLPVLVHDDKAIQGSSDIITYLDQINPNNPLTPDTSEAQIEAEQWENTLDKEIGIHVRRASYCLLLDHPRSLIPKLTQGGPWYGKPMMKLVYPKLKQLMRAKMDINQHAYVESVDIIDTFVEKLKSHLQNRQYLVGDQFSRADLSAGALLGPLCAPADPTMPAKFEALKNKYRDRLPWITNLLQNHR